MPAPALVVEGKEGLEQVDGAVAEVGGGVSRGCHVETL